MQNNFINKLKQYQSYWILAVLVIISVSFFYIFSQNNLHLLYGDALSRMNISRKIIDNLTPGLAQLGNVWLPLPQLFMLPMIWNNTLWHTGIAGAIMSMSAYIVGGIFLYKGLKIVTNSFVSSFLALLVYALNINILYLQITAMSEALFTCFLLMAIYFFLLWVKTKNKMALIPAAISISAITLIRYEALAVLLASIPMVFFYTWWSSKKYHRAESLTLLYGILACLGFGLWTIYLAAIFGDPLYWLHYYTSSHVVSDGSTQLHVFSNHATLPQAITTYFTSTVWMNGLIPTLLAIIAIPIVMYRSIKDKSYYFLPIFLSLSMFLFMILTLMRNTPIEQPTLTITNIISSNTSEFDEFNIRYGLMMLPLITYLCAYLFNIKSIVLKIFLFMLLGIQFYSYVDTQYSVIYQLPISVRDTNTQGTPKEREMVAWLKNNYDGGKIMISALKHDPQMFQLGFDYKTYIHEGTGRYWKESTKDPQRYAKYVVFDSYNKDDQVTKYLKNSQALKLYYNPVYSNEGMFVYKIKTKPDIILN